MKKQFFNIYLAVIAVGVIVTGGCKKNIDSLVNNSNSEYYVRFKANGLQQNYTIPVTTSQFHDSLTFNGNKVHIFSTGGANMSLHSIAIGLYDNTLLTSAATYKESDLIFGFHPKVMFIYNNNPGSFAYYSIGTYAPIPDLFPEYAGIERDCIVTLTNVTATTIQGTFSGIVYHEKNNGDADVADKIKITAGEFFLPAKF